MWRLLPRVIGELRRYVHVRQHSVKLCFDHLIALAPPQWLAAFAETLEAVEPALDEAMS
jgi:hypothetical protein